VPSAVAISQLARIIGRPVLERLGLSPGDVLPDALSSELEREMQQLTGAHAERIADALAQEASASDDVHDTGSAMLYLEDRLRFLGSLLTEDTRIRVRDGFRSAVGAWGAGGSG
jgi:hypothetical protein